MSNIVRIENGKYKEFPLNGDMEKAVHNACSILGYFECSYDSVLGLVFRYTHDNEKQYISLLICDEPFVDLVYEQMSAAEYFTTNRIFKVLAEDLSSEEECLKVAAKILREELQKNQANQIELFNSSINSLSFGYREFNESI